MSRLTAPDRRDDALEQLSRGARTFQSERFETAYRQLLTAKELSPRSPSVRELLGLSAYRTSRWDVALKELRAYRRMTGDTVHMPEEMDCLRALDRPQDVRKTWERFSELGGPAPTDAEVRVVFGSFLLDQGDPRGAWRVTQPQRLGRQPRSWELRRWYVAARAAAQLSDKQTARQLRDAIRRADPQFEGLDELDDEVA